MAEFAANRRRRDLLDILLLPAGLLLSVVTTLLVASGVPGPQFQVNTFTAGTQRDPAVAVGGNGSFVVAWTSFGQESSGDAGIFAQRYDSTGTPIGSEIPVNTFTAGDQFDPAVGMDGAGHFVVAWTSFDQDGDGLGIFAQRYDASGQPVGLEFPVNTTTAGNQSGPAVAMNAAGNFVIAWTSGLFGSAQEIFYQRYDSTGTPIGSEFQVNTSAGDIFDQPTVAMDAAGNFVVAWTSNASDPFVTSVLARRFDSTGMPLGGEFPVNTSSGARNPAAGMDQAGNFVVAWQTSNFSVHAQRFDASGTGLGSEFQVNTVSFFGERPAVAMNPSGNFVVTGVSDDGETILIFAQCYDANGTPQGSEFQVNDPSSDVSSRRNPAAGIDPMGNFVIAWTGFDSSSEGVVARRYTAAAPAALSLSINDVSVTEGNSGTTDATFTVTLSAASTETVTVDFGTADSTALSGDDYEASFGTLFFNPGETSKQIVVRLNGDTLSEPDERFFVNLTNPSNNASLAKGRGIGTILNDDFTVSISDAVAVPEGNSGTVPAVFFVNLSGASGQTATVDFATADGTATLADNDYVANSGTLTFNPGETNKQLTVLINGDTRNEFNETFFVNLSNPTNAAIADAQGLSSIRNDDFGSAVAGNQFQVNFTFFGSQFQPAVGMNAAGSSVIVWTSQVPDATGFLASTGIFAQRFDARGIIQGPEFRVDDPTFATGQNRQPAVSMDAAGNFVIVWTGGGGLAGLDSDFQFSEVYGQRFDANGTPQGTNFVVNGNGNPFTPGAQQRPSVGMYASGDFVVAWDGPGNGSAFRVFAQRFDANGARVGTEFEVDTFTAGFNPKVAVNPAACVIPPGPPLPGGCSLPDFVIVWAGGGSGDGAGIFARRFDGSNGLPHGDQFLVNTYTENVQERPAVGMDAAGNFVVAWEGEGTGAIRGIFGQRFDEDGTPLGWCVPVPPLPVACSLTDLQINTGTTDVDRPTVGVRSNGDFVIAWDGFETITSPITSLNRAIFARSFDRLGTPNGGPEFLVNQTFPLGEFDPDVRMDAGGNFVIAWVGTDASLDGVFARRFTATPAISISDSRVLEGDSGATTATFTVTLSTASTQPVSVGFATADATATEADSDYLAKSDTVNFSPGQTAQNITVTVNGDTTAESDETFVVDLSNPVNAVIARGQGVGTIVNDDCALSINDVTVAEGNSGTVAAVFTVNLPCPRGQAVTVDFATADGTATAADNDYAAQSGTRTFLSGETSKAISVVVIGDTTAEPDETFFVNLSNATNVTIGKAQGAGTITNDDAVQIVVNETITVSDAPGVLPSAMIGVAENITVTDAPDVLPSAMIGVSENIAVTDAPQVFDTAVGTNVTVRAANAGGGPSPVTVTFAEVTQPGNTTLTISASGPAPPPGFALGDPPVYFDLSTTAVFSGPVTVCIDRAGISFFRVPKLFHFENGAWIDVTTSVTATTICGVVSSLSPFALFAPSFTATFLPPLTQSTDPLNPVLNAGKNGRVIPVKIQLSQDATAITDQNTPGPVTIAVSKLASCSSGAGSDPIASYADAGQSSAGTNQFRFDATAQAWIYNLDTKALGFVIGNCYRIDVSVNGAQATNAFAVLEPK